MLDIISNRLPQYRHYVAICAERTSIDHTRLMKSLGLVYADIIDLCKQIYVLLTKRRPGMFKVFAYPPPSSPDLQAS